MGKKLNHQTNLENYKPKGCMWKAISNHFLNKKWHPNAKKCSPKPKLIKSQHPNDQGKANLPPKPPINGHGETGKPPRPSFRSRLKALVAERMPKRRDRNGRCSSHAKLPLGKFADRNNDSGHALGDKSLKRAFSFDELIDKYNRLLEISNSSNGEVKDGGTGKILSGFSSGTASPVSLERTLSLPDLSPYFQFQIEDRSLDTTPDLSVNEMTTSAEASEDEFGGQEDRDSKLEIEDSPSESKTAIGADDEILPRIPVDEKDKSEFAHVKHILEQSNLIGTVNRHHSATKEMVDSENERSGIGDDTLMFDLVNEVLLGNLERRRSFSQGRRASIGNGGALEEVLTEIRPLLRCRAEIDGRGGDVMRWDMANWDRWMELHSDAESVAVEVEGLIYEDLLNDIFTH